MHTLLPFADYWDTGMALDIQLLRNQIAEAITIQAEITKPDCIRQRYDSVEAWRHYGEALHCYIEALKACHRIREASSYDGKLFRKTYEQFIHLNVRIKHPDWVKNQKVTSKMRQNLKFKGRSDEVVERIKIRLQLVKRKISVAQWLKDVGFPTPLSLAHVKELEAYEKRLGRKRNAPKLETLNYYDRFKWPEPYEPVELIYRDTL